MRERKENVKATAEISSFTLLIAFLIRLFYFFLIVYLF